MRASNQRMRSMKRWCKLSAFFVLAATATRLSGASPEPVQQPLQLLGLGPAINQEFTKLTDFGVTPFVAYYGIFQGNPVGGIQQQTAYSHLILFGATLNFDKLLGIPKGSLMISGADAAGKNLWQGFIPRRDRDQLLLTYLVSSFSRNYADSVVGGKRPANEHVLEASYAIYISDYYTIQPDIQYVIRPNGTDAVKNSLVIGIQFIANL
jgi:carbohydrate-selective porin OprB